MNTEPLALRLADRLSGHGGLTFVEMHAAAAELRRLHAENESLRQIVHDFPPVEAELREVSDRAHRLEAQRDALLEVLKNIAADHEYFSGDTLSYARAALKAALAEPVQDVKGCDVCEHPLYAGIKCRVCGRVTPGGSDE